ncbi:ATP-grasp domain-containing protein [Niallia sp. HCP3S3_B10]|uniref:ATP-grasp domain-containing protein n=1 Tax=Niallia sp. HCP3S3_B10 TaxID=3438944 RepID=UPI003F8B76FA
MTNILMLSPFKSDYFGVNKWVSDDFDNKYYIITKKNNINSYQNIENKENIFIFYINSWNPDLIRELAKDIFNKYSIDRVFSYSEGDVYLAATIREYLGISGQNIASAEFFRNKYIMNKYVKKAGINAPVTQKVKTIYDLYNFSKNNSFPIIIKPIDGSGSSNTFIIKNNENIREFSYLNFDENKYICQNFIKSNLYHIDGLQLDNENKYILVSKYLDSTLGYKDNKSTASIQLNGSDETSQRLTEYTYDLLKKIPIPENSLFHLELFYDGKEIVFLEIASRIGGGRIQQVIQEQFGLDPIHELLKKDINPDYTIDFKLKERQMVYGWILITPKFGNIEMLPFDLEDIKSIYGVFNILQFAQIGKKYENAHSSVEAIYAIALKGKSVEDVKIKLIEVEKYINNRVSYSI